MLISWFERVTRASLSLHWLTVAIAAATLAAGLFAASELRLELLPRVDLPRMTVLLQWPQQKSAEQFASRVTLPLETDLRAIPGVVNVESTTNPGVAVLTLRNNFGLEQSAIWSQIKARLARAQLPAGVDVQVLSFSPSDLPVVVASASSARLSLAELKRQVERDLQPRLQKLPQVKQVIIRGGQELPRADTAPPARPSSALSDSARLSNLLMQGAASAGVRVEFARDITPELLPRIAPGLPLLNTEHLRRLPPETIARLPSAFLEPLDPDLRTDLDQLASAYGGAGRLAVGEPQPPYALPTVEPVPIAQSWIDVAASAGHAATTTADVPWRAMDLIAPDYLKDLTPPMWRALAPEVLEVAFATDNVNGVERSKIERSGAPLSPLLLTQLEALRNAGYGKEPKPKPLPDAWLRLAAENQLPIRTTRDVSRQRLSAIAWASPTALAAVSAETLLAFSPATLMGLPAGYIATLDEGMQQTIRNIIIWHVRFVALGAPSATSATTATGTASSASSADPARLSDQLIEGARLGGLDIQTARDISPAMMRQLTAFGRQGVDILKLLTPGNLRALRPEVIALLPPRYLETLDPRGRAELDQLAGEWGGAGQLALKEAKANDAATASALYLAGAWTKAPALFRTAADLLNNPVAPSAAAFLNQLPDSSRVDDPAAYLYALTPRVLKYLTDNEKDFARNLSPFALELLSPDSLNFLLDTHADAFTPEVAQRLRAIAQGEITVFVPKSTITRTNRNPSVQLNIFRADDANTVIVAHRIFDLLKQYEAEHPEVTFALVFEQASLIEDSVRDVSLEGLLGALGMVVVILIFLSGRAGGRYQLSWRATLVTAVSIPLSLLAALALMRWLPPTIGAWLNGLSRATGNPLIAALLPFFPDNFTLNIMTLSALAVALGRVVDDAIVVLENIYRFVQKGYQPHAAAIEGTREVAAAIFASTATTVGVFLPLGLIGGVIGELFLPFALSVTYALAASFLVAISVVPTLACLLISKEHLPDAHDTPMQRAYTPILHWALSHRGATLALAALLFMGSVALTARLPRSFIPSFGEPTLTVTVELPGGTRMRDSDALLRQFENALANVPGLKTVQSEVGSDGGFASYFGNSGVRQNVANVSSTLTHPGELSRLTPRVRELAEQIFGAKYVSVSGAARAGFSGFSLILTGDSAAQLESLVNDVKQTLGAIDLNRAGRPDIVNIVSNVDQSAAAGAHSIIHIDGKPAIRFSGEIESENVLGVTNAAYEALARLPNLPAGVQVSKGADSQQQSEGFASMAQAIGVSILIVYALMVLTFRSLIQPFTILFSLPFALVGAALALFVTGSVLGLPSMLGLLMLVGIVVTNAIVLMQRVQQLRQRGLDAQAALIEAGRTRLRPTWMTAATTMLALLPLAIANRGGTIIAGDLAISVIGGLLVSTLLTLLVVPVVYSLFDRLAPRSTKSF